MEFYDLLAEVIQLLQREGRASYRALKRQFNLDDDYLEDLKDAILYAHPVTDDGRGLVWTGDKTSEPTPTPSASDTKPDVAPTAEPEREPLSYTPPHLAEKILTTRSALEGERKQVTVLFCDLQNSTPLAEQIGPENMHALLNRFFELALSEVHRYEMTVNQFLGDGFMAISGAPISHEDHARRAVLSAIGLQRRLKESNPGKPYGVECRFRIGINSGLVVVGSIGDNLRMDYSAIGDTTNLASRLQTSAEPGEILVSETTARLVEGYIRLEALTPVEVKGKAEPIPIYKVEGTLPRRSPIVSRSERTLSEFVGRERELATLEELFAQVESGNGQVVGIVAEAGQGKSRLLYEFRQRLEGKQVTYLEGRCLSYGSSIPYHPIIDIVRNNCGITETDSPEAVIEKVSTALQEVGMDAEASAPYILRLLGVQEGTEAISMLTPEAIRTRTFETLRQMSLSGAQRRPLIFEVEDLHWQDRTSEDYLSSLVESLAGASILLLTTYRPGYQPPWLGKSYATQISLHNLLQQDALAIVHSTSRSQSFPEHLEQEILSKAEGNPFFLEELTRAVIEYGNFQADTTVPDTIQGVLSARIDRLPDTHKHLLQTASVLGREFSPRLLAEIWDGPDALDGLLSDLQRMEFLFERNGASEAVYVFKHALTQDVSYESLLTTRRQSLHTAAGQALETLYEGHLEDAYDRLAYHYAKTDNAPKAIEYLTLVAERAAQGYAHAEAVAMLQEALVHAERLTAQERDQSMLELSIRQAESFHFLSQRHQAIELLCPQLERLKRLQEASLTARYYLILAQTHNFLGEREKATQAAQHALTAAERAHDTVMMGRAYSVLGSEDYSAGRLQQAVEHCQQAVTLLKVSGASPDLGYAYYVLGLAYYFRGTFPVALDAAQQLRNISHAIGDDRLQANSASLFALIYLGQDDWEEGLAAVQYGLERSPDAFETALFVGQLGIAYMQKGDLTQAIPILEDAVQQARQYRSRQVQCRVSCSLSETYYRNGDIERARDTAYQSLALAKEIQYLFGIGSAQHIFGRIAYHWGNFSEATSHLQETLEIFASIDSRFELARTHLDLAALAHTQNDLDTATTHLSTAYAWFKKLQVPKWEEHTEQLAQEYGVTLIEVELDDMTEGLS